MSQPAKETGRANLDPGVIVNGSVAALIDDLARIVWCCLPRFDAAANHSELLQTLASYDLIGVRGARPAPAGVLLIA